VATRDVNMRNTPGASDEINKIADQNAPAVNISCVTATTKEVTFRISGTDADVSKVFLAGQRARLW
jgi:hypothetical protein